jgi:uncharacterized repeat protein (TIGR01451 family)
VVSAKAAPQFSAGGSPYLPLVQAQVCGVNGNGCNPSPNAYSTSISGVQPGDNVWIMLYYNNTGTGTANNVRFTLSPQSTGVVNSQTFTGTLTADNANSLSGSATVNLAQGQTLTYYSTKVYGHNAVLLSSTQGTDLFNGGLNIGSVHDSSDCPSSDTFCHQGVVVVTYKVSQNQITPPPSQYCQITQFTASPSSVTSGGSSTLTWNTSGCVSAIVSGGIVYASSLNGSQNTGSLYGTTSYTITAYGSNGSPVTQTVSVYVNQQQSCTVNYFNASPNSVSYGNSATLSWSTTGATSVYISGLSGYNYNQSASGSVSTGPVYGSQTYTLTANCQNGSTQTQTVYVSAINQVCSINSFYASPSSVTSGSATTLYWSTTNASSVSISGLSGYNYNQSLSGSAYTGAIYGGQTYTLTAYCQNGGQSQTQSVYVSVNQPAQSTQVYTGAPTNITSTSARLYGNLTQSGGLSTQVYFQWGTSSAFGFTTSQQYAGSATSVPFFDTITGLTPDTIYYYRAVAVNSSGTFYGETQSFATKTTSVVTPPVVVVSGVGSGSNLIALDINNNQQINACVGNIVSYLVTYKNISGKTLNNVVLQVLLPEDVEFQSSNPGIYNAADHTITLAIGTLIKDQTGTMNVTGVVMRSAINRNLIVAQATIAFTNPVNSAQETAIAYGLGNTTNCNSLAGLALFGDGFWPTTLIGWLVLILILLALIYLAILLRRNYRRNGGAPNGSYSTNGGMRNQHGPSQAHYEDMDVPVYNNH